MIFLDMFRKCRKIHFESLLAHMYTHCTLSVQLFSDFTSVNSVFVSDKIIYNSDNFRIKCLFFSKISAIFFFFIFCSYTFLFNVGEHAIISVRKIRFTYYI